MIVLAFAAALQLTPAAETGAPAFSFREITSATTRTDAVSARLVERCGPDVLADRPVTRCGAAPALWRPGISGFEFYGLFLSFDAVGLAAFDTAILPAGFAPVRSAFTQKFGEPCSDEASIVSNAVGGQFPQQTVTWCLSDGRLELRRLAARNIERSQILFVSDRFLATDLPRGDVNF
jgi:hypothetical protein